MKHAHPTLRPGMTALAAALALTSTSLFAQDLAPVPVEPSAPVVAAPVPAVEPAQPAATAPSAALNIPKISVDLSDVPATSSAEVAPPAAKPSSAVPAEGRAVAEQPAPASVKKAPVTAAATPPAASEPTVAMTEGPAPESPLPTPPVAIEPPAPMAAAPAPAATEATASSMDETLPVAGGVLAALALAGGAFAVVGRRRRYRDDYRSVDAAEPPVAKEVEPVTLRTPISSQPVASYSTPKPAVETASAALPAGFDLSRYGPHVQAAYRGPTPDNPSRSLRTRLKRARFYDQRERMEVADTPERPISSQIAAPQPVRHADFVSARKYNLGNGGFRPAYQG